MKLNHKFLFLLIIILGSCSQKEAEDVEILDIDRNITTENLKQFGFFFDQEGYPRFYSKMIGDTVINYLVDNKNNIYAKRIIYSVSNKPDSVFISDFFKKRDCELISSIVIRNNPVFLEDENENFCLIKHNITNELYEVYFKTGNNSILVYKDFEKRRQSGSRARQGSLNPR
jgi:hypothetical protein